MSVNKFHKSFKTGYKALNAFDDPGNIRVHILDFLINISKDDLDEPKDGNDEGTKSETSDMVSVRPAEASQKGNSIIIIREVPGGGHRTQNKNI